MRFLVLFLVGVYIGFSWGNKEGDQATLRDCATLGKAVMQGGGAISCKVQEDAMEGSRP